MKKELQRIKIAEACGWKKQVIKDSQYECGSHACTHDIHIRWTHPDCDYSPTLHDGDTSYLPDYLNDLNAMHKAEKVLTDDLVDTYVTTLCLNVQPVPMLYHATAAQRAEAFLRTIGKWEDGE